MREVPLHGPKTAGRVALVDDADYELVMAYRWRVHEGYISRTAYGPYARAQVQRNGIQRKIYMHALITGYRQTDHANGNGLDNRRQNLREATASQNHANQGKVRGYAGKPTASRYKGVTRHGSRWSARIVVNGRQRRLGCYLNETDAARAYDRAAREAWGSFARCNFEDS
jgi:hypothetical protein